MTTPRNARQRNDSGGVAFVGAGPGDPGLLTLRAVEALNGADVVVIDETVPHQILEHAPELVEVVDVSVDDAGVALTASARGRRVAQAAKNGRRVVRLLEGDPFSHPTGSDEVLSCVKGGIPFEVVAGVATSTAVPTHAGIPLVSGRRRSAQLIDVGGKIDLHSCTADTLVFTGITEQLADVAQGLVDAGRVPSTPIAVVTRGSTVEQQTLVSTLADVVGAVKAAKTEGPYVLVVGDAVEYRDSLSWFETKPLFGWRVLVPRTKEQAGSLTAALRKSGAVPEEVPTISVEPPRNPQQIDKAVRGMVEGRYEWIAFTSFNALRAVKEKLVGYGLDARALSGLKVAAVGEKTAEALRAWGVEPDLVPSGEQSAMGLLADWPPYDEVLDPINRVFLPRADIATETLAAGLSEMGWEVDDVTAYRTVRAAPPPAATREAIKTGKFDAVLFTSSSTVRNLVGIAGKPHANTVIACIGPATAKTAEEHGLRVDVMAPEPSVELLAEAVADFGASRRASLLEAGEPLLRPSQRRRSASRRKSAQ
ncbi:uroporphyrinogen-III synthase [Phytoactinopolyspora halotolerans]|uniref:uroporphyrinogen-III C-methyltransferase n=1 Tax=Phytoactinopolyspora halotolerans TaxID=1981512 RepID=A0A6L9S5L4_9ACTN|nr:bifunctional uroporphyrinogen-III C-methyltransferase/uroporphyrinogen-III synthase [Phytoactinopolyspora halotolerans]NEE00337.1 bifunctional uroporphyrinogen-III C-methyltransferase/uroporphyrinogen-III synthase [Phytoactinopolyspora halotolerans]